MKTSKQTLRLALLLAALTFSVGCSYTKTSGISRVGLLQNLEFDHADMEAYTVDLSTGKTNRYEKWSIDGVKSDTQKALGTIEKALDKIPQKP